MGSDLPRSPFGDLLHLLSELPAHVSGHCKQIAARQHQLIDLEWTEASVLPKGTPVSDVLQLFRGSECPSVVLLRPEEGPPLLAGKTMGSSVNAHRMSLGKFEWGLPPESDPLIRLDDLCLADKGCQHIMEGAMMQDSLFCAGDQIYASCFFEAAASYPRRGADLCAIYDPDVLKEVREPRM